MAKVSVSGTGNGNGNGNANGNVNGNGNANGNGKWVAPNATEWALALLVIAGALVARAWGIASLGVNHFDEGVYLLSALGLSDPSQPFTLFPNQVRFSPPFYFTTISLLHRVSGLPIDVAAIVLSIVFGTATVAIVWWFGRGWFGPRAALAGAALLALSQAHILMSRVALTDAAFSFLFLLTVALIIEAIERKNLRYAIAAGLSGALIWNTKYHGWFTLLVTGAALVPSFWYARKQLATLRRPIVLWGTAALIAALLYVPWALYIRASDSYREITNYYLTLISTQWFENLWRHVQQQLFLDGAIGRAAPLVALAVVLAVRERADVESEDLNRVGTSTTRGPSWLPVLLLLGVTAVASYLLGFFGLVTILALVAALTLVREFGSYRNRVLLAWLGLWIVAAPVYHPYARLLLPFTVLTCILAGAFFARFTAPWVNGDGRTADDDVAESREAPAAAAPRPSLAFIPSSIGTIAPGVAVLLAVIVGAIVAQGPPAGNPWRPARDLAVAADAIADIVPEGRDVYVLGEPPLAYYVTVSGRNAFRRVGMADLDTITQTAWLVTGTYADRAPNLARGITERADRLTRLRTIPFRPNDLRLLDDARPTLARQYLALPDTTFDLTIYRIEPR